MAIGGGFERWFWSLDFSSAAALVRQQAPLNDQPRHAFLYLMLLDSI
jgi:hypothetical protein